jgi:hypothetical protein
MRRGFRKANGPGSTEVDIANQVIGPGEPGAKSRMLDKIRPLIDAIAGKDAGVDSIPQMSITPALMKEYLDRVGASHERPEEAQQLIENGGFSGAEMDALAQAMSPFKDLHIMVRSDEWTAAGVGFCHSDAMLAGNSDESVARFAAIAKKILRSEFSPSAIAFKKRLRQPLEANMGVLVTPLDACLISFFPPIFSTVLHANVITRFDGSEALVSVGLGLGGGNGQGAKTRLLTALCRGVWEETDLQNIEQAPAVYEGRIHPLFDIPSGERGVRKLAMMCGIGEFAGLEVVTAMFGMLRAGIKELDGSVGRPLYLELAAGNRPIWDVVQCAETSSKEVAKPDVPESQKIFNSETDRGRHHTDFGKGIFGRGVVESRTVVYAENTHEFPGMVKGLENYVLIAPELRIRNVRDCYRFCDYADAAAIICAPETRGGAFSHLNGAIREAGITVLAGEIDKTFLNDLKPGANQRKLLVYADDAHERAFVATMD